MSRIRILHLLVSLPVGGAENLLLSILKCLNQDKYESIVCTLGERGVLASQVERLGVKVIDLGLMRNGRGRQKLVGVLTQLMADEQISLLHSHLYHANYIGRLAARRLRIPCVASIHNTYTNPKWHRRLINWWLAKSHTDAIIAGSDEIKQDIIKYDWVQEQLIRVIPNSVDLSLSESQLSWKEARNRLNIKPDVYVIGTVGRLEEQKGHSYLLSALSKLVDNGQNVSLLLIGEGRQEVSLRKQALSLSIEDNVQFLGTRSDLGDLFQAMDLFVMPSLWEGLSLAMLSAMAAGLATVATDVGGVRKVLDESRGFIIEPGNASLLSKQITWCMGHPAECAKISESGARFVHEYYSDAGMVRKVEGVYREVLE